MRGTHRATAVGAGLMGGVEHVDHGHAEVHSQGVNHEGAIAHEQRQTIA